MKNKIKLEISKNIVIYILSIILVLLVFFALNSFALKDYFQTRTTVDLILNRKLILDEELEKQYMGTYNIQYQKAKKVLIVEAVFFSIYAILGIVILVYDIFLKINMFDKLIKKKAKEIEKLEFIEEQYKYEELQSIDREINLTISNIKEKERQTKEMYENIIHDFSTPLHIISGSLELYDNGMEFDFKSVKEEVEKLKELLKYNIKNSSFIYYNLSSEELEKYFKTIAKINPNINFVLNIQKDLIFRTQKNQFYRIVNNIVDNAIKHSKCEEISIFLYTQNSNMFLEINNSGIPIEKEDINKIFQRKHSTQGSGLGLDIVKNIIDDLGYEISVDSQKNQTKWIIKI